MVCVHVAVQGWAELGLAVDDRPLRIIVDDRRIEDIIDIDM